MMCGFNRDRFVSPDSTLDIWVVKVDGEGRQVWSRTFGSPNAGDESMSVIETDSSEYLVVGRSAGEIAALKVDDEGRMIWLNRYGTGIAQAVIELKSGEYVIAGYGNRRAILLCINSDGEVLWQCCYGEVSSDAFYCLRETDGGIVAGGAVFRAAGCRR